MKRPPSDNSPNDSGLALKTDVRGQLMSTGKFNPTHIYGSGVNAIKEIRCVSAQNLLKDGSWFAEEVELCEGACAMSYTADFLLYKNDWPTPLAILCMHQAVSGSISMKVSDWLLVLHSQAYPVDCPTVMLLCGTNMPKRTIACARRYQPLLEGKLRGVWSNTDELRKWLLRGSPYPVNAADEVTMFSQGATGA